MNHSHIIVYLLCSVCFDLDWGLHCWLLQSQNCELIIREATKCLAKWCWHVTMSCACTQLILTVSSFVAVCLNKVEKCIKWRQLCMPCTLDALSLLAQTLQHASIDQRLESHAIITNPIIRPWYYRSFLFPTYYSIIMHYYYSQFFPLLSCL